MSSPNKVTRLWEGVGVGVLVEVARDEWKQERRVDLMWLPQPEHLNPFLSLHNTHVALGCLAWKDVLAHECSSSAEGIEGLSHPPGSRILGHVPPRLSLPWGQPAVGTGESPEALGSCLILMKEHTEAWKEAQHSAAQRPGSAMCQCGISGVDVDFSHMLCTGLLLLLWSQQRPAHTEDLKISSLGFLVLLAPSCADGAPLLSHGTCWDTKVCKEMVQGKAGGQKGRRTELCSACSCVTFSGPFHPWLEKDAKAPFCSYKSCL